MIKTNCKLVSFVAYLILSVVPFLGIAQSTTVPFTFSLSTAARTSAGVFRKDGTLIKTLWSGVNYSSGAHNAQWDGTDDQGMLVSDSSYDIRVLSNNVNYAWEGVVGNTSAQTSGSTVLRSFQTMNSMAIVGSTAYYTTNYNEITTATFKINTASPQSKTSISAKGGGINLVATDNNYVYWAGYDPFDLTKTYVYATRVSDDQQVTFSAGAPLSLVYITTPMVSCIDIGNNTNSTISGLAVQKTGNYLFVAHQKINRLDVLNKTTGALVRTISITAPAALAVDASGNLWMANGAVVSKYSVNTDGSLTPAIISLPAFSLPLAIAVSADNNTVVISDGGSSQQLKAYNNNSGNPSWIYGQPGGYVNDATVTNDKFYFTDIENVNRSFVSFAPDGSFWVGDPGDNRSLHFASDRTFIEQIMFMPHSYACTADPNNPSRAFADYLEFKIDYSKSLDPQNSSWTLVKNWGYNITSAYNDQSRFHTVVTLANGRTYGLVRHGNAWAIGELVPNGGLRLTGNETPDLTYQVNADGSMTSGLYIHAGSLTPYINMPLKGFDGANNPIWGAANIVVPAPTFSPTDPRGGNPVITSSNVVVSFDAGLNPGFHLAGIKPGSNKWLWRTAASTSTSYSGAFPPDGSYDIGNRVQYGGSVVLAMDRSVIWGYHGEFWKNSQTNKWNQVYDDGLFVGQFGTTGPEGVGEAAPMMAGNALAAAIVKDPSGNYYLYHCDESVHAGLHRWKITGLNTIQEQTIPVVLTDSTHGLLGIYIDGIDLNNFNIKTTRVDKTVNFNWGSAIPGGTQISNSNNYSVRWSGYVKSNYSEKYVFTINTSSKVRLWVDDSLIVDKWTNNSVSTFNSTPILLNAGNRYTVRLEYGNANVAAGTESLSWSSPSQPGQIVPSANLFPSAPSDTSNGVDLMEGLHFYRILENNLYGWNRNPTQEDVANPNYIKYWSVLTGYGTPYTPSGSPDVYAHFTQSTATYTVTRDLGSSTGSVKSWKLLGALNFEGNNSNLGSAGGMYFEVLDAAGKVLTRFQTVLSVNGTTTIAAAANTTNIIQASAGTVQSVIFQNQPISISVTNGVAIFQYGPYAPVSVPIFDATGNWQTPKTMRIYFWQNGGTNYGHAIDLVNMRFSYNGSSATPPPPNKPPVAIADPAQTITLPVNSAVLIGKKSYDPDGSIISYAWTLVSGTGGSITSANSASTTVTGLTQGVYIYKLTVTDNGDSTASAMDTITVKQAAILPPIANAGADQTIILPLSSATVDGSASKDQNNGGVISSYAWIQSSGPSQATIATAGQAKTIISGLQTGQYIFKLTVTNLFGITATDSVSIFVKAAVNIPPVANAGASRSITLPVNSITLDGSLSNDTDGTISAYGWTQISGPSTANLVNAGAAITQADNLVSGVYIFQLTVTDNSGASSTAQVKITVVAAGLQLPIANAGANQTITLPNNQVILDGSGSVAPSGNIISYSWTQSSGPSAAAFGTPGASSTTAGSLIAGTYVFTLTIKDNNNATATDSVTILVNPAANIPPVANAGISITIFLPANTVSLDGSKSSDPDGTISGYSWTRISGPNNPASTGANTAIVSLSGLQAGQYVYQLTVTDNQGATSGALVKITVVAAPNIAPIANAGTDQTITAPSSTVTLDGSASYDPDGTISVYSWVLISGPGAVTINNGNTASPAVAGLATGQYSFQLTVTDNNGATSNDQVVITVNPPSSLPNQSPVANAGNNLTITAPVNSVQLNGTRSFDPDGTIIHYQWSQVSGPSAAGFSNNGTASPTATGLIVGTYVFELLVTDNNGASNSDQVTVIVNPSVNKVNLVPVADAGSDTTIYLPAGSYTLNATGSYDPDGTIAGYQWQEIGGPNTAGASSMNSAEVSLSNLQQGAYRFQLTVTDNQGASSTAEVSITVGKSPSSTDQLVLFPNPAHDVITGRLSSPINGTVRVNVYDMNGRLVLADQTEKSLQVLEKTLNISALASGMYTVQINISNQRTMVAKFIKQ
jgi:PA14 domain/Secretion system C-terminal sorting domain/PKD domain